jgi:predicted dehydrogenase
MGDDTVRLGLIGAGRWGRNYIRTINGLPDVTLAAVASTNPATAALVHADCRIVADWRRLLTFGDIGGVIIATPPALHASMIEAAAASGKAVLVEKPLVGNGADLAVVGAAAAKASRVIMVDHTHLFHPAFLTLLGEARMRGPIQSIRASAGNHGPYRHDVPVLWDWGAHDLAMCLALDAGPWTAERIECSARRIVEGCTAERLCLTMRSEAHVSADLRLSTLDDRHRWFAVDLANATLIYSDIGPDKLKLCPSRGASPACGGQTIAFGEELPLTRAVIEFATAIRQGRRRDDTLRIGIEVVRLLAAFDALKKDASGS